MKEDLSACGMWWSKPPQSEAVRSDEIQWEHHIKEKDTRVGNGLLNSEYSHLFFEQPNLEDEIYHKGGRLVTPRFLALSFSFGFLRIFIWSSFSVAMWSWNLGRSSLLPLPSGLSLPNLPQDHVISILAQLQYFFIGNIPFSIKGITLFALGCEATYISATPKNSHKIRINPLDHIFHKYAKTHPCLVQK